jgi:manganese oxidase
MPITRLLAGSFAGIRPPRDARRRWFIGVLHGGLAGAVVLAAGLAIALSGGTFAAQGQTRIYFIAADEVDWNYAPSDVDRITGEPFSEVAETWVEGGADRIGRVYRKALYREYTDGSFSTLKPRGPEWEHLGALGPVIYAAVGDTIEVVFKNNTRHPFSVHAHGVLYTKANEGALYNDGTDEADKADDAVAPGATYRYVWQVPERAGPGPSDPSSVLWMYHSHVDEVADTNTGLVGPLVVTRREVARPDGRPADVDREFFTFFNVYNENLSIYLDHNIRTFAGRPDRVNKDDEEFEEANLKHAINGYLFGTLPGLTMRHGERVRWYAFSLGSEEGIHTTHWHGLTGLWHGMRMDGLDLMPMSMKILDMVADAPGTWLYHCHVNDHLIGGMQALLTVQR